MCLADFADRRDLFCDSRVDYCAQISQVARIKKLMLRNQGSLTGSHSLIEALAEVSLTTDELRCQHLRS